MAQAFDYLVCMSQAGKVTFVNGEWQGRPMGQQPVREYRDRLMESCPELSDYLQRAGAEGWELVAAYAVTVEGHTHEKLILKRAR
jgi:hypothetical protein